MAKKLTEIDPFENNSNQPEIVPIEDFLHNNGLEYAHYVITDRALISDDGLKPVNRRILYAMYKMGLKPTSKKTKANRIVGETIGKYHPHGNLAVSAALARMGQTFSLRVPLIDVQGSVGFLTGDKPAADRYWEATISSAAHELLKDIENNGAVLVPTEDGDGVEPDKLPVRWPNGIINGSQGIAVGYASNLPPHNPTEVMTACIEYVKGKVNSTKSLMKHIKGPDFPTGGEIIGVDGIKDYFETGSGTFTIRGKYKINDLPRGRKAIEFYELPYQVSAEKIKEEIDKHQSKDKNPKFQEISEVKDLSDRRSGLRLVIYVKSGANINSLIEDIWKLTSCQSKFSTNNTVLIEGAPNPGTPMVKLIEQFVYFRKSVIKRKTVFELEKLKREHNRLAGILIVLTDIDKAIEIIKKSDNDEEATTKLISHFKINEEQAKSILQMRLKSLTKADSNELINKQKELSERIDFLELMLSDETVFNNELIKELEETRKIIKSDRITSIHNMTNEEFKEQEKLLTKQGNALSKDIDCFVEITGDNKLVLKLDDEETTNNKVSTTSKGQLLLITKNGEAIEGNVSTLSPNVPISSTSFGIAEEDFLTIATAETSIFLGTNMGNGIIVKNNKPGKIVSLLPMEEVIYAKAITDSDLEKDVITLSYDGILNRFPLNKVRKINSGGGTVTLTAIEDVMFISIIENSDIIFTETENTTKYTELEDCPTKSRGAKGYSLHKLDKDEKLTQAKIIREYLPDLEISGRGKKGSKK